MNLQYFLDFLGKNIAHINYLGVLRFISPQVMDGNMSLFRALECYDFSSLTEILASLFNIGKYAYVNKHRICHNNHA